MPIFILINKGGYMFITVMFSFLLIMTKEKNGDDFQRVYIPISRIDYIDMTDIPKGGGIISIYLFKRKEEAVYQCNDKVEWEEVKDFIAKHIYGISKEFDKDNINIDIDGAMGEYPRE